GVNYLADLSSSIATRANFQSYERLVLDAYKLRSSRNSALSFAENPTDENLIKLYNRLSELQELGVDNGESIRDVLVEIYEEMYTPCDDITGIDTGLTDLNIMTGGLQNGDLIIVAARPSMGKTAFALNLALANCKSGGVTDVFSLEMSKKQLIQRMISSLANVNSSKWRNPYKLMTNEDRDRISFAVNEIEKMSLNIHDQSGQSIYDIRAA